VKGGGKNRGEENLSTKFRSVLNSKKEKKMKKTIVSMVLGLFVGSTIIFAVDVGPSHGFEIMIFNYEDFRWFHLEPSGFEDVDANVNLYEGYHGYYYMTMKEWFMDEKGRIQSQGYNGCLEVNDIIRGGTVGLNRCDDGIRQKWTITGVEIRAFSGSDFCLDVPGGDFRRGQSLQIWPCNGTDAQAFRISSFTISTVEKVNDKRLYLDVNPDNEKLMLINEDNYNLWDYDGWFLSGEKRIQESNGEYECLDYPWGGYLYTHSCHNDTNQKWSFSKGEIRAFGNSEFCVDVPGRNFVHGQETQIWPCNDTIAQKWVIE